MARYTTDGQLDTTFNSPLGYHILSALSGMVDNDEFPGDHHICLAIQNDDKIIVAGETESDISPGQQVFGVARLDVSGVYDLSFNDPNGYVKTDLWSGTAYEGSDDSVPKRVAIQIDGKIVVVGHADHAICPAIIRYNSNGSIDTTFLPGGMYKSGALDGNWSGSDPGMSTYNAIRGYGNWYDVKIQTDNKIIACGRIWHQGPNNSTNGNPAFLLRRYNIDGSVDINFGAVGDLPGIPPTYNEPGVVVTSFIDPMAYPADQDEFPGECAMQIVIQPSNNYIVAAGWVEETGSPPPSETKLALSRYDTWGVLDTSFGVNGMVVTDICANGLSHFRATSVALDKYEKILVGGFGDHLIDGSTHTGWILAQYNKDGSLDESFGPNNSGMIITDISNNETLCHLFDLVTDNTNNKIYAVGRSQTPEQLTIVKYDIPCQNVIDTNIDNVVARYNISDHVLDASGDSAQLEVSWVDGLSLIHI